MTTQARRNARKRTRMQLDASSITLNEENTDPQLITAINERSREFNDQVRQLMMEFWLQDTTKLAYFLNRWKFLDRMSKELMEQQVRMISGKKPMDIDVLKRSHMAIAAATPFDKLRIRALAQVAKLEGYDEKTKEAIRGRKTAERELKKALKQVEKLEAKLDRYEGKEIEETGDIGLDV